MLKPRLKVRPFIEWNKIKIIWDRFDIEEQYLLSLVILDLPEDKRPKII